MQRNALEHIQTVIDSGNMFSIGGIAEGEARPAVRALGDALDIEARSNPPFGT